VLSIASADLLDEPFVVGLSIFSGRTLAFSIMATVLAEAYNAHHRGDATDARFELGPPPVLESRLLPRPAVASGSVATAAAGRALATRSAQALSSPGPRVGRGGASEQRRQQPIADFTAQRPGIAGCAPCALCARRSPAARVFAVRRRAHGAADWVASIVRALHAEQVAYPYTCVGSLPN
jgi:hypothetical protein